MLHGQKLATIKLCAGLAAMTCLSFGPLPPKGLVWICHAFGIQVN